MNRTAAMMLPRGLQSHGRSLLAWPDLLEPPGIEWLRHVVPFGVRLVIFGELRQCPIWPGPVESVRLNLYLTERGEAEPAQKEGLLESDVCSLQELQAACGLTRLPNSVLCGDPSWQHRVVRENGLPMAAASAQQLNYSVGGLAQPPSLVCGVAVREGHRRRGLGRTVVEDLRRSVSTVDLAALTVAAEPASNAFFLGAGWLDSGAVVETAQWS